MKEYAARALMSELAESWRTCANRKCGDLWFERRRDARYLPLAPRNTGPEALVKIIDQNLRQDLGYRDRAGHLGTSGDQECDEEGVDAAGGAPAHRLGQRAGVRFVQCASRPPNAPADFFASTGSPGTAPAPSTQPMPKVS